MKLSAAPPTIHVSTKPAVLVNINGETAWVPTGVDDFDFAANTNWDLFQHEHKGKTSYYLLNGQGWLRAEGERVSMQVVEELKEEVERLKADLSRTPRLRSV